MHIHLNLGTRVMLYSLSILVIHRFFNYKQCMVYMQLMSKRDYTICCVCETHYTCLRSKKHPHETHINWRQLARNAYIGFQHKVVSNIWKSKLMDTTLWIWDHAICKPYLCINGVVLLKVYIKMIYIECNSNWKWTPPEKNRIQTGFELSWHGKRALSKIWTKRGKSQ